MNTKIHPRLTGRYAFALLFGLVLGGSAWAGTVSLPHSFQAGEKAVAAEVNANFDAVASAVNDNDNRIGTLETADLINRLKTLESSVSQLQTDLAAAQSTIGSLETDLATANSTIASLQNDLADANATIGTLQSDLADIQANSVLGLDSYLSFDATGLHGRPVARFEGVNVQIVNGMGQSSSTNGLGNLIVGYDEALPFGNEICSYGGYDNQTDCESNGYTWAISHKSGSHNLVVGMYHNYSRHGGAVFGFANTINGTEATVTGGTENTASGLYSSVSGGRKNTASGADSSAVSGGYGNKASGNGSTVSGGANLTASTAYTHVP